MLGAAAPPADPGGDRRSPSASRVSDVRSTATLMIDVDVTGDGDGVRGNGGPTVEPTDQDALFEALSWAIRAAVRTSDAVHRCAPSRFCVLLPATTGVDALLVGDRVRARLAAMPSLAEGCVSIGVATGRAGDVREAMERARAALDVARRTGSRCDWTMRFG